MIDSIHKQQLKRIELVASADWKFVYSSLGTYPTETSNLAYTYLCKPSVGRPYSTIRVAEVGDTDIEFLLKMHEIGHTYFNHLQQANGENPMEKYNNYLKKLYREKGEELVNMINLKCGTADADILIEKLIDDPQARHLLWNQAEDCEVNSRLLNLDDIEQLEGYISTLLPDSDEKSKEEKEQAKIKLIHPVRYHLPSGEPFPIGKTYLDYFQLIVENLDQFIKVVVSIGMGGNGDTEGVSAEDVKEQLGDGGLGDFIDKAVKESNEEDHKSPNRGDNCEESPSRGDGTDTTIHKVDITVDPLVDFLKTIVRRFREKVRIISDKTNRVHKLNRGIGYGSLEIASISHRYRQTIDTQENIKLVFLIDVSSSMPIKLIDRILKTVSKALFRIDKDLCYDIVAWNTELVKHFKEVSPQKPIVEIPVGGGTSLANGIIYFKKKFDKRSVLVIVSDFQDNLDQWQAAEKVLSKETEVYGVKYNNDEDTKSLWSKIIERSFTYNQ